MCEIYAKRPCLPPPAFLQASFLPLSLFVLEVGYGDSAMPMVDEVDRAIPMVDEVYSATLMVDEVDSATRSTVLPPW